MSTKKFEFRRLVMVNMSVTRDIRNTRKRHANRINLSLGHVDGSLPETRIELTHRKARAVARFILANT